MIALASAFVGLLEVGLAADTLSWKMEKRSVFTDGRPEALFERSGSWVDSSLVDIHAYNGQDAYYVNMTIGTPPQPLTLLVDTGSADLYVDASTAPQCIQGLCRGGVFDPAASSTYQVLSPGGLNASFGDSSTATGDYGSDVIGIGDVQISNVQFGVANSVYSGSGQPINLVGLQFDSTEATSHLYPNLPDVLEQAGVINSRLFSIWLNARDATGSLVFGGIDTSAYTGKLYTFDFMPIGDKVQLPLVLMTGIGIQSPSYSMDPTPLHMPAYLDTGNPNWINVPENIYDGIVQAFGGAVGADRSIACSHMGDNVTVSVSFQDFTVQVSASNMITQQYHPSNGTAITVNGEPQCMLSVVKGNSPLTTMGDVVMRSMYMVFDYDRGEISLAAANPNPSSGPNIVVVQPGEGGVAAAVGSLNGGVQTSLPQSYALPPMQNATVSFAVSTVSPAIGTATGPGAVPMDGQVSGGYTSSTTTQPNGGPASGTSSSTATSTSKGAASSLCPLLDIVGIVQAMAAWIFFIGIGFGLGY